MYKKSISFEQSQESLYRSILPATGMSRRSTDSLSFELHQNHYSTIADNKTLARIIVNIVNIFLFRLEFRLLLDIRFMIPLVSFSNSKVIRDNLRSLNTGFALFRCLNALH